MMNNERPGQLNVIFDELAEQLNISKSMEEKAAKSYVAVGKWLGVEKANVDVYPQGSFSLGTVVRPLSGEDDDYDIDLVCCIPELEDAPAQRIKSAVGDRLKEHEHYKKALRSEGKRCWTLDYDEFHMDVLPCTVDETFCELPYGGTSVRLTHKLNSGGYEDHYSNPKGYEGWFEKRMEQTLLAEKRRIAHIANRSIEDVKAFETRTPLQKAIQILKQHRNVMFEGINGAPISIIITTLAALSYGGEQGTYDALCAIAGRMRFHISTGYGAYVVQNPVDSRENFADKWKEEPKRAENFFRWLDKVEYDFGGKLLEARGLDNIGRKLEHSVGKTIADRTLNSYGVGMNESRRNGGLYASAAGLSTVVASGSLLVPDHSFYGDSFETL